jgi:hypothetical protein
MADKIFADGFIFKRREQAPEFVIGEIAVKVEDATAFIQEHEKNGWVNLDVKLSQGGKYYIELNTYEPQAGGGKKSKPKAKVAAQTPEPWEEEEEGEDDLPF